MTISEWKAAGLDFSCDSNGVYEFRCVASHEADLPVDVRAGSSAVIDNGTTVAKVKLLRKDTGGSAWVEF